MNKKIKIEVAIGIILIIFLVGGWFFWKLNGTETDLKYRTEIDSDKIKKQFTFVERYFYYYDNRPVYIKLVKFQDGRPVFMSEDENISKCKLVYENLFNVKLKEGFTLNDFESLNKANNVSIVEKMLYTEDSFLLKVENEDITNALQMANKYQKEKMIQYAGPNFLTICPKIEPWQ